MLLKEAIAFYITNDSPVYCIMLDATKAFNYCKLFREVMKRNLPFAYRPICFMLNLYISRVMWNFDTFNVLNGIKQGALFVQFCFVFISTDCYASNLTAGWDSL